MIPMRLILIVALLISATFSYAQTEDYPDYRSKKELFTRIQEKDIRSDIASFSMGGLDESIGKLPLKTIPPTGFGSDFISFSGDNIQVKITSAPFDKTKHKLGFYEKDYLIKIDNKPYFGDYGKVPSTYVASVTVIVGRDTINVPATACTDLCNPLLTFTEKGKQKSNNKVFLSADGRKIYVYMLKKEAGGSYEATWVIQDKKYLKRVVDFGFLK
ncbi:MAG TPA: hypothetical protein VF623_14370 [Segetibacter sp.]|jgi:hypothetical protein